jgi:Bacterial membrane protein YfhO
MTKSNRFDSFAPFVFLLLAIIYTCPFFTKLTYWGVRDWDLFTAVAAAPVRSILEYGQFPFWNPWMAGGNILFHHPEVGVLSPFFVINLILGVVVGLKIQVVICYWLGFWGSYRMARILGQSPVASALVSVAYFGSVHFAMHFAEGHMPFTHFAFLPWFVEGVIRSVSNKRFMLFATIAMALMILGNGAAVPFLYTLTFCGLLFLLFDLKEGTARLTSRFALVTFLAIGISAVKFIPMTMYLMENSWTGNPSESIPLSALGSIFLGWNHSLFSENFAGQSWAWHEYGAFLLPLTLILSAWGVTRQFASHWPWLAVMVFFFVFGLGDFGGLSPWKLLSHLPGFDALRCSGRSFQFVILCVSILAGFGLDNFAQQLRPTLARPISWACALLILSANLWFCLPIMNSAFIMPPKAIVQGREFEQVTERDRRAYELFLENKGALITPQLSAYHPSRALVDANDKVIPEYVTSGKASVSFRDISPNKLVYGIQASEKGELAVSMGYDRGWEATSGAVENFSGVLSFPFASGEQTITLTYLPPGFWAGIITTTLSVLVVLVLFLRSR